MDTKETRKGQHRKIKIVVPVIAVVCAAALAVGMREDVRQGLERFFDPDAVSSEDKPKSVELDEIRRGLQQEADESSFRIKINSQISVDDEGVADLLLANSAENHYNMQVTITGTTGQEYYKSEELTPGEQILTDTLEQKLSAGEHPATARFQALDPETGEMQGEVTVEITIENKGDIR